jgi:hypothetical protein
VAAVYTNDLVHQSKGRSMSISGIGGAGGASQLLAASQPKVDRPNDGDGDAADAPKAQAAPTPAPGTGLTVNKTA